MRSSNTCRAINLVFACLIGYSIHTNLITIACGQEQEALQTDNDAPKVAELPIQIIDSDGKPIPGVTIVPWALGSGQGHGIWGPFEGKPDESGMEPVSAVTNAAGLATIKYPYFRDPREMIRTLTVSVRFEHPDYAYDDSEHIDVPIADGPYKVTMTSAASIVIQPTNDGRPVSTDGIYAMWSNPKSWQSDFRPENLPSGKVKVGGFLPGENRILLVRVVENSITHFSEIATVETKPGQTAEVTLPLLLPRRVIGKLSENVPRPVRNGRIVARTIPSAQSDRVVMWTDWTSVAEDGSFAFEAWPANERIQIIALCDGFIATSGEPTEDLLSESRAYHRPHVFDVGQMDIVIPMMPLIPVTVTITNEKDLPLTDLDVASSPNVGWWKYGSQIYARNLVRGRELILKRDYRQASDDKSPELFRARTNSQGQVTLQLPVGKQILELLSEDYELAAELGVRYRRLKIEEGCPLKVTFQAQAKGTDRLGDWDKLAGVVYGCSTIEGRRILALPGMKEKMEDFVTRFREAKNQNDKEMLSNAYQVLADAFLAAGEKEEALKWRRKAHEQRN